MAVTDLEKEGDTAADYLEALLDIADLDGDIDLDVGNGRALVSIVGADLDSLVGSGGHVLEALQYLARLAVNREHDNHSRLMLDISGYRAAVREVLWARGLEAAEQALGGDAVRMEPMNAFERKVVHDAVATTTAVSESDGVEPNRFVVVRAPSA